MQLLFLQATSLEFQITRYEEMCSVPRFDASIPAVRLPLRLVDDALQMNPEPEIGAFFVTPAPSNLGARSYGINQPKAYDELSRA